MMRDLFGNELPDLPRRRAGRPRQRGVDVPTTEEEVGQTRPSTAPEAGDAQVKPDTPPSTAKPTLSADDLPVDDLRRAAIASAQLDGWTTGPIDACVSCGRGVALRDPNNRPRHRHCAEEL